ncbi:glutathione S-transferase [Acidocella sp. KAb 2-4]|uniref:glutathione S-transferase n=1 Tax=Acidocella sp. KAb 2-4 TaxID=2885158 RepID=UPI001D0879CC|nr:glutathione S-transferase [Acidocella sp. KAb 2-4]MCB5945764.1 glutathione S-transferase [Acidocella sp. KAb 2-4]
MTAKLYLGTARYSSWSMRGWLVVHLAGLRAEEIFVPLVGGNSPEVKKVSPSGTVPYLEHEGARIWESLAIAEYCAEINPSLWPEDRIERAHARAIAAEMHAGYRALRLAMPMNLGRTYPGLGQNPESLADVARIDALWGETRARFGGSGPYLFGETFNAADAMFAPVVARFITYAPPLSPAARAYCDAVRAHPLIAKWYELAAKEPVTWQLEKYENLA